MQNTYPILELDPAPEAIIEPSSRTVVRLERFGDRLQNGRKR